MTDKILIVGAGFTALSTAWELVKAGYKNITILEKDKLVGGLSAGWQEKNWRWSLDKHYRHVFNSDTKLKNLIQELGLEKKLVFSLPESAFWTDKEIISVFSMLKNPRAFWPIAQLKLKKSWQPLEKIRATSWLKKNLDINTFKTYWEPLFKGKFGKYQSQISLAWFWARIKQRTIKLGYYQGGFQKLADDLTQKLVKKGVNFKFQQTVKQIGRTNHGFEVITNRQRFRTDKLIVTIPLPEAIDLLWFLPEKLRKLWGKIEFLHCQTLILATAEPIIDKVYWLNISDSNFPFVGLMAHTNFVDKKYYNNQHITYLGKYLTEKDPLWHLNKKDLLTLYWPFIKRINPQLNRKSLKRSWLFKDNFTQPVVKTNYSSLKPTISTPISNLYIANMAHIYPWDRGLNYAIGLGKQTAEKIIKED